MLGCNGSTYLAVKTTSQQHYSRDFKIGCNSTRGYFFLQEKIAWFKKDTWVLLAPPEELTPAQFVKAKFEGDLKYLAHIPDWAIRDILDCIKLTDDISPHQISLLDD